MKDGFIKIGAASPEIRPADCEFNADSIIKVITQAHDAGVRLLVLPELCVTGCTCGDLFLHSTLQTGARKALERIVSSTAAFDMVCAVGIPFRLGENLTSCAAVFTKGRILGMIPKKNIPDHDEFCEGRWFTGMDKPVVFTCTEYPEFSFGVELSEDLECIAPPSGRLALSGANIILNLSAASETAGKAGYRRALVSGQSARLICAYACANAGIGESTTDLVFSGHDIIAENGEILSESRLFGSSLITADIDLGRISFERGKNTCFSPIQEAQIVEFSLTPGDTKIERRFPRLPFIPENDAECAGCCELILDIQAHALVKRLEHSGSEKMVIGISGGLDSTLALIVCAKAADLMKRPRSCVTAVTMPCFGTSVQTRNNAHELCGLIGAELREIDITAAVEQHFADIGHDPSVHNTAYENAQARERTQVLMDIANDCGGLVIGTGDLSELALGWATFGGDHISMYGVNASVAKTLVRRIVGWKADTCGDPRLKDVLYSILDTPVSPELLPAEDGAVSQKTEELVGPYELHDFFLYYMLRYGYSPKKLFRIACSAFSGKYDGDFILKWLKIFLRRFFSQQFKRSCLPDGPKTGSVSLSPRADLKMPSDACVRLWLDEAERISPVK